MEISAFVRSDNGFPLSLAIPYSVTMQSTSFFPVVTQAPGVRVGLIFVMVSFFAVDEKAI